MPRGVYPRTKAHVEKTKANLSKGREPSARKKATEKIIAVWTEDKRRVMSEKMKKVMRQPAVRRKHLRGLRSSEAIRTGANFKGGNGQKPTQLITTLTKILKPVGFTPEYPVPTFGHGTGCKPPDCYKIDFANPTTKIGIEVDGVCHRSTKQKEKDAKKSTVLKALGWKLIRLKHR